MAPEYRVFTVENSQVLSEERRPKPHHAHHPDGQHHDHGHDDMFAPVADCRVLLCGGMGTPAYQKALATGLEVVLTGGEIGPAVQAYLSGQTNSDLRRVHQH
jgi:hypothetical protein